MKMFSKLLSLFPYIPFLCLHIVYFHNQFTYFSYLVPLFCLSPLFLFFLFSQQFSPIFMIFLLSSVFHINCIFLLFPLVSLFFKNILFSQFSLFSQSSLFSPLFHSQTQSYIVKNSHTQSYIVIHSLINSLTQSYTCKVS